LEKKLKNKTNKVFHPTMTRYHGNPSYPTLISNKDYETRSYVFEAKSFMYARITKSMLEFSKDGYEEFIITIA
jgi:hypothetical protein